MKREEERESETEREIEKKNLTNLLVSSLFQAARLFRTSVWTASTTSLSAQRLCSQTARRLFTSDRYAREKRKERRKREVERERTRFQEKRRKRDGWIRGNEQAREEQEIRREEVVLSFSLLAVRHKAEENRHKASLRGAARDGTPYGSRYSQNEVRCARSRQRGAEAAKAAQSFEDKEHLHKRLRR